MANNIAGMIGKKKTRMESEDEYNERTGHLQGFDGVPMESKNYMKTWDPEEHARETPKPLLLRKRVQAEAKHSTTEDHPVGDWQNWIHRPEFQNRPFVIFGAGASTLDMPLSLLDGHVVYGINWTLKWFDPTFLQIIDGHPFHSEIRENPMWKGQGQRVQLVTSTRCAKDHSGAAAPGHLKFKIAHHAYADVAQHNWFAENPDETITWFANSLGYACNVAYWFKPSRIVLLGMDFGGAHFFGDGRAVGSMCHYGLGGTVKKRLLEDLRVLRDDLSERGMPVVHVGPTKLDLFPQTNDLERALNG